MPRLYSVSIGGGSGNSITFRADKVVIANGAQTLNITFSSPIGNTSYPIICDIYNDVDPAPIYLTGVVRAQTSAGFTFELSAPTDSGNYYLSYMAVITA